jgi:hypothetical protein
MKNVDSTAHGQASARFLQIAGWATFLIFTAASLGLLYPIPIIEGALQSGKIPPLPRAVMDLLPDRHYWHIFTAISLLLALASRDRALPSRTFRVWAWIILVFLWMVLYLGSNLVGFYMNLYTISQFNFELQVRVVLAIYATMVAAIILSVRFWPGPANR